MRLEVDHRGKLLPGEESTAHKTFCGDSSLGKGGLLVGRACVTFLLIFLFFAKKKK